MASILRTRGLEDLKNKTVKKWRIKRLRDELNKTVLRAESIKAQLQKLEGVTVDKKVFVDKGSSPSHYHIDFDGEGTPNKDIGGAT